MTQRNYRDPLHNIITLDESMPEDRLLVELIDSAEFQRLRRIKQLGIAMFTYQGAEHSRFTHSIGVMHLMTRAMHLLGSKHSVADRSRIVGRVGALLHDLGHGPFSHVIEHVFGFHHENWTRRVVLDEDTEVNAILRRFDPELPERLVALYDHTFSPAFVCQLVSSQLDCDRMDYLLRDSLMTGAKYGIYDLEWVLHALRIDEQADRIFVEAKGLYAVEEYLQARYYMFRQVYFHRTLRSAEAVLVSALRRARELMDQDCLSFRMPGSVFERMLHGEQVTTKEFLQLDDADVTFHLKQYSREGDPVLSDLAKRFINRRLFKGIEIDLDEEAIRRIWPRAEEIVSNAGFDPRLYLVLDRASDAPYYGLYSPAGVDPKNLIFVETAGPHPDIREISEVSQVVRGMKGFKIDRLCVPHEVADQITSLVSEAATPAGTEGGR